MDALLIFTDSRSGSNQAVEHRHAVGGFDDQFVLVLVQVAPLGLLKQVVNKAPALLKLGLVLRDEPVLVDGHRRALPS